MLFGTNTGVHNAGAIDRKFVFFANFGAQEGKKFTCNFSSFTIFAFTQHICALRTCQNKAKNDDTLGITDTPHFTFTGLQVFRGIDHLPDVMFAFAPKIVVALHTGISFQNHREKGPQRLLRIAHGKVTAGNELMKDRVNLHGGCFIVLLGTYLQMTGIDTTALLEKIAYGKGTFIIDYTTGFINQLVTELITKSLDRYFVNSAIRGDTGNNIAKSDDFAEFGRDARHATM